jgi:hypothetical protein
VGSNKHGRKYLLGAGPGARRRAGDARARDMANSVATGQGVIVANEGMNELAGNPSFRRPDGAHVVIDAPDYTANGSNDEDYRERQGIPPDRLR